METINTKIAGWFKHPESKEILNSLPPGGEVLFEKEPTNVYDKNAIALFLADAGPSLSADMGNGEKIETADIAHRRVRIGYVPRDVAAFLSDKRISSIAYGAKFGEILISWNVADKESACAQ